MYKDERPLVLFVDDVESQRKLYDLIADKLGVRAHIVESASHAMLALNEFQPDMIVLDWVMPNEDGLTCATAIRRRLEEQERPVPPIVCISARAHETDRTQVLKSGLDDYLSKPFSFDELKQLLHKWLRTKFARSEQQPS